MVAASEMVLADGQQSLWQGSDCRTSGLQTGVKISVGITSSTAEKPAEQQQKLNMGQSLTHADSLSPCLPNCSRFLEDTRLQLTCEKKLNT